MASRPPGLDGWSNSHWRNRMNGWRELRFPVASLKKQVLVIEDDRASILFDPLRWQILEALGDGKSVAELSQSLEVSDARVLYHLKRLAQTGVVSLQKDGRKPRNWRCLPAAGKIRAREVSPSEGASLRGHACRCCRPVQSGRSRSCRGPVSGWPPRPRSITTARGYPRNRRPSLVVGCWR